MAPQSSMTARGGAPLGSEISAPGKDTNSKPAAGLPRIDVRISSEDALSIVEERKRIITEITTAEALLRKKEHQKREEVYKDRTKEYALQVIRAEMEVTSVQEMENRCPNVSISKKIINKKARVYKNPPSRIVKTDKPVEKIEGKTAQLSPEQKALDKTCELLRIDSVMKKANRKVELHHNILVAPLPRCKGKDEDGGERYEIALSVYSPRYYDVICDAETGIEPIVIIFSYQSQQTAEAGAPTYRSATGFNQVTAGASNSKIGTTNQRFVFWSAKYHFTTDDKGQIIESESPEEKEKGIPLNPIGRLPFVSINKDQDGNYWAEGGEDLTDNAILINVLLADLYYIAKFQGMGILFMTGKDIKKNISIGPGRVVGMSYDKEEDPEPKLSVVNANPPIQDHLRMIENLVALTLTTNDLEPGDVSGKLETPAGASSGIQEIIQRSEISTAIEDEEEIFKNKEPEIINIALAWLKLYGGKSLLTEEFQEIEIPESMEKIDYNLKFDPPQLVVDEGQQVDILTKKKSSGLYTRRELVAEAHPELTEEQLTEFMIKLDAEQAAAMAAEVEKFKAMNPKGSEDKDEPDDKKKIGDKKPPIPPVPEKK